MHVPEEDITGLLQAVAGGDRQAEEELISLVYKELRRIASRQMKHEGPAHTLQATALVHEAYIRLARPSVQWQNRAHFYAVAARVMRRLLIDAARARKAGKRGDGAIVLGDVQEISIAIGDDPDRVLEIDRVLTRLADFDPRQARIVELRFFAGMTVEEISEAIGISARTVKREWTMAKAWLYGELSAGHDPPPTQP